MPKQIFENKIKEYHSDIKDILEESRYIEENLSELPEYDVRDLINNMIKLRVRLKNIIYDIRNLQYK